MLEVEAVAQVPAQPGKVSHHHDIDQAGAAHLEQSVKVRPGCFGPGDSTVEKVPNVLPTVLPDERFGAGELGFR